MKDFCDKLKDVTLATKDQSRTELWDAEGILHNQKFKFDLRPIKNDAKIGHFNSKADKMVFEFKDQYIIVDLSELHQYLKQKRTKETHIQELMSELDWNIILPKK